MRGEPESILLLFFFIWGYFDCWWLMVGGAGQKVLFIFLFLVLLKEIRMRGQSNSFPCFHSFRNLPPSQKLWKKFSKSTPSRKLRTWTSVTSPKTRRQPWHPQKTTSYIHHTNYTTKSPFLHTQLQIEATPKRRIHFQNHNFKVHQPNTHNISTCYNQAIHCNPETWSPLPNHKFLKLTRKSSPPTLMSLSLTHHHSNEHFNKSTCLHSLFSPYFKQQLWVSSRISLAGIELTIKWFVKKPSQKLWVFMNCLCHVF